MLRLSQSDVDFDGLGLCFCFVRQCCLRPALYNLSGTSIMESAVLRAGGPTKVWGSVTLNC